MNATDNKLIPLPVRVALADAALSYANALAAGDAFDTETARSALEAAAEDCRICQRAYDLGMDYND